ncbi:hypothetical protein GH741_12705 [Aquibacillus halophilus]|uniref:Lipoprotein n=1 Tax=Aquibacillus halophilus TaxID=930132 RepID=A0A6A8DE71_9BACI|nr:hypothetical protein [Aquibacillus halophilus]MRH43540.1 hypothetical protein [Aquibacillus halophilus]
MKKMMFLFLMIGILVITASCSGNKLEGTKPPIPDVEIDSVNTPVVRGGYCWYECADAPSIPGIVERKQPTIVSKNARINITFNSEPKPNNISITRRKKDEKSLYKQPLTVPCEQGVYYYEINAKWDYDDLDADSSYAFVIEVK